MRSQKRIRVRRREESENLTDLPAEGTDIPDGMTRRLKTVKGELSDSRSRRITTYRARAITKIARENPGMPKIDAARQNASGTAVRLLRLSSRTTS